MNEAATFVPTFSPTETYAWSQSRREHHSSRHLPCTPVFLVARPIVLLWSIVSSTGKFDLWPRGSIKGSLALSLLFCCLCRHYYCNCSHSRISSRSHSGLAACRHCYCNFSHSHTFPFCQTFGTDFPSGRIDLPTVYGRVHTRVHCWDYPYRWKSPYLPLTSVISVGFCPT